AQGYASRKPALIVILNDAPECKVKPRQPNWCGTGTPAGACIIEVRIGHRQECLCHTIRMTRPLLYRLQKRNYTSTIALARSQSYRCLKGRYLDPLMLPRLLPTTPQIPQPGRRSP